MSNFRGNFYSKEHVSLPIDSDEYWNFSWHEMAMNDLPTFIDFILHHTKYEKLWYAGHSQGTTTLFIMSSRLPEYGNKIKGAFALAPIAYMSHTESTLLKLVAKLQSELGVCLLHEVSWSFMRWNAWLCHWISFPQALLKLIGVNEFLPTEGFISQVGEKMCKDTMPDFLANACSNIVFLMCGFDQAELNSVSSSFRNTDPTLWMKLLTRYFPSRRWCLTS